MLPRDLEEKFHNQFGAEVDSHPYTVAKLIAVSVFSCLTVSLGIIGLPLYSGFQAGGFGTGHYLGAACGFISLGVSLWWPVQWHNSMRFTEVDFGLRRIHVPGNKWMPHGFPRTSVGFDAVGKIDVTEREFSNGQQWRRYDLLPHVGRTQSRP